MPRREEPRRELITREFQKGNFITREKWEWEQGDKRIASYDKWNEEIVSECLNLQKKLKSENIEIIIEPRSFRNLTEGIGFEKFSDNRNYLAKEVVEVTLGTKKTVYFSGKYTTLAELITAIKTILLMHNETQVMPLTKEMAMKQLGEAVEVLLHAMGENVKRPDLEKTPERVAKFLMSYSPEKEEPEITLFPDEGEGMMVIVNDLEVRSLCAHHLYLFSVQRV